jgi:glycosyltransferase involved in cell wall biosynthesis
MSAVPRISIGMPLYNAAAYLEGALDSLLAQSEPDFELFISDNASTDTTEDICRAYAKRDPRIRYTRNAENIGAAANFNRVFQETRAPYFLWAAFDDGWHPDFLRETAAVLDAKPEASMASTGIVFIDEDGNPVPRADDHQNFGTEGLSAKDALKTLLLRGGWYGAYSLMRRRHLAATPLFQAVPGADAVLQLAMLLQGDVVLVPEPLFYYRVFQKKSPAAQAATIGNPKDAKAVIKFIQIPMLLVMVELLRTSPFVAEGERAKLIKTLFKTLRGHKIWYRRLRDEIVPYLMAPAMPQRGLVARELLVLKIYPLRKLLVR